MKHTWTEMKLVREQILTIVHSIAKYKLVPVVGFVTRGTGGDGKGKTVTESDWLVWKYCTCMDLRVFGEVQPPEMK